MSMSSPNLWADNPVDIQETATVLLELSHRSGLPEDELNKLLANCDMDQQSMYFCAWRDQVIADRTLKRAMTNKEDKIPACKAAIESKIASWEQSRDKSCEKSAKKEWGNGSMKPTAQIKCVASETLKMVKRLGVMRGCDHF